MVDALTPCCQRFVVDSERLELRPAAQTDLQGKNSIRRPESPTVDGAGAFTNNVSSFNSLHRTLLKS